MGASQRVSRRHVSKRLLQRTLVAAFCIAKLATPAFALADNAASAPADPGSAPASITAPSTQTQALTTSTSGLLARSETDHAVSSRAPRHRILGLSMDVGIPDGAGLGLSVRPLVDWLRVTGAVTHNGLAPGARLGATLDPIPYAVGPTLTVEGGHAWPGAVPGLRSSALVSYTYANIHLGLEFGSRESFRFFLRGGVSYLDISGADALLSTSSESKVANPAFSGWLAPTAKLGFSLYF